MENINAYHKSMNFDESYENVKTLYKKLPDMIMQPDRWLKEALELRKE